MSNVVSSIEPFMAKKAHEAVDKLLAINKQNYDNELYGRLIYEFTDSFFSALRDNSAVFIPMTSSAYVMPADEDDQNPPIRFGYTINLESISLVRDSQRDEVVKIPPAVDVLTVVNEAITPARCRELYDLCLKQGRASNAMIFAEALVKCVGGTVENGAMAGVPAVLGAVISTLGNCLTENGSSMAPTMPQRKDGKVSWFFLYTDRVITVTFHLDNYTNALEAFAVRHQQEKDSFKEGEESFVRILTVDL